MNFPSLTVDIFSLSRCLLGQFTHNATVAISRELTAEAQRRHGSRFGIETY